MQFIVLPSSSNPLGLFYSPEYSITNNGSKTLEMKIKNFKRNERRLKVNRHSCGYS